jgi:hypothetical protein
LVLERDLREGGGGRLWAHILQKVSELLTGVGVRVRYGVQPLFVIVEEVAKLDIHLMSLRDADNDTVFKFGGRIDTVAGNDVVCLGLVPDSYPYFI